VTDLRHLVGQTWDLLSPLAEKRRITLSLLGDDEPRMVLADTTQLQQVFSNLVLNAIQAMPKGGTVTLELCRERTQPPDAVGGPEREYHRISVQDEGEGIPEKDLERLFEPFFTTKNAGEGTGLGLSIAQGIIREHGGWIEVASRPGQGSRFSIFLPQPSDLPGESDQ
jgi:signal transduction histidine kinase